MVMKVAPWRIMRDKTALLVIDMQNAFVEEGGPLEVPMARACVPAIQKLLAACRQLGIPVIYTVSSHYVDGVLVSPLELAYQPELKARLIKPGTHAYEIYASLAPRPGDFVLQKHRFDAFYNTNLDTLLHTMRFPTVIDTVIITGTVTSICCESTARSAFMRDYKVAFASDGTGGLDADSHNATLRILGRCFARVMTVDEIIGELKEPASRP